MSSLSESSERKINNLLKGRERVFRKLNRHLKLRYFCAVSLVCSGINSVVFAAFKIWFVSLGFVFMALLFGVAEMVHARAVERERVNFDLMTKVICGMRGDVF